MGDLLLTRWLWCISLKNDLFLTSAELASALTSIIKPRGEKATEDPRCLIKARLTDQWPGCLIAPHKLQLQRLNIRQKGCHAFKSVLDTNKNKVKCTLGTTRWVSN